MNFSAISHDDNHNNLAGSIDFNMLSRDVELSDTEKSEYDEEHIMSAIKIQQAWKNHKNGIMNTRNPHTKKRVFFKKNLFEA